MARLMKSRKKVLAACLVSTLVVALAQVPTASPLGLPSVTVSTSTVPVKTLVGTVTLPSISVTTPSASTTKAGATVTTPTVSTKALSVSVKTPTIPTVSVKGPSAAAKTSTPSPKALTVTVKTTAPLADSTKAPSVTTKVPVGSLRAPDLRVTSPVVTVRSGGSAKTPLSVDVSAGSPRVGTSSGGTSRPAAPVARPSDSVSSSGGASGEGGAGSVAGSAAAATHGPLGAGYGRLPAIEGAPGSHVRARIAWRERVLKATVARLQGCLGDLPSTQRQLLELRAGLGPLDPLGPSATAARLGVAPARFRQLERRALRELRSAGRAGGCRRMADIIVGVGSFIAHGFGEPGAGNGASSGVLGVRYEHAPSAAGAHRSPSSSKPLLGVGIPDADLVFLLLIPLIVIGLTILDVLTRGTRRGPLDKYFKRVVAPGYTPARRRAHRRSRR